LSQSTVTPISVDQLLENGVHFGHRASRWNPKMKPYIHGKRNTIHIIDLQQTVKGLVRASHFLKSIASEGGKILWVGTKRSAREAIRGVAVRTGMPWVTERWLGGTLTNFETIRSRLARLAELDQIEATGSLELMTKKAQARFNTERKKILKNLEGLRELEGMPAVVVVVDPRNEDIAVAESNKRRVPVVAILDTDCDPEVVDIAIPGNDDAMRSVRLLLDKLGDAVEEGVRSWGMVVAEREKAEGEKRREEDTRREVQRQRDQVTEDWQRRLREEADRRRAGVASAPGTGAPGEEPITPAADLGVPPTPGAKEDDEE
jgi:small subunit ribosomal protein S2